MLTLLVMYLEIYEGLSLSQNMREKSKLQKHNEPRIICF